MTKHKIIIGAIVLTLAYFGAVAWVHYGGSDSSLATYVEEHKLNSLGDFLAGVFSPLAFLWLTATVLIQSNELALQRKELHDNREVMKDQAEAAKRQAEFIGLQTQAMRDQIELQKRVAEASYKASLLKERFTVYSEFLERRNSLLKSTPMQLMVFVKVISQASLLFGDEMADQMNVVISDLISYCVDLEGFERKYGDHSFVHYQERLETDNWNGTSIQMHELDAFKDELQDLIDAAKDFDDQVNGYRILQRMRAAMSMELSLSTHTDKIV